MRSLDTNVIIRYLVNDDRAQAEAARSFIATLTADDPGFVCREVLVELSWALDRCYQFSRDSIADIFLALTATEELHIENASDVVRAAEDYRCGGAEFSDRMIVAASTRLGDGKLYTFDKTAAKLSGAILL